MDIRQQVIERILALDEDDLQKVIAYLEERRESALGLQEQNPADS